MARKSTRSTEEQRFADYVSRQLEKVTTPQKRLQAHHRIGRRILQFIPENEWAKYGSYTARLLADAVGRHQGWIRTLRNFGIQYSADDLKELCTLDHISWAHVRRLLALGSKSRRRRLQKRISRERLGLKDVQMLVRGSEKERRRRGRTVTLPGDWQTALRRMMADWETWTHGWEAFKKRIEKTPAHKRSKAFRKAMREAAAFLKEAAGEAKSLAGEIKSAAKPPRRRR